MTGELTHGGGGCFPESLRYQAIGNASVQARPGKCGQTWRMITDGTEEVEGFLPIHYDIGKALRAGKTLSRS